MYHNLWHNDTYSSGEQDGLHIGGFVNGGTDILMYLMCSCLLCVSAFRSFITPSFNSMESAERNSSRSNANDPADYDSEWEYESDSDDINLRESFNISLTIPPEPVESLVNSPKESSTSLLEGIPIPPKYDDVVIITSDPSEKRWVMDVEREF